MIAALAAGWWIWPGWTGVVAFGLMFTFAWGPMILMRLVPAATMRLWPGLAALLTKVVFFLHPTKPFRIQAERLGVLELEHRGDLAGTVRRLEQTLERH